jgi:putative sterol carrier protein
MDSGMSDIDELIAGMQAKAATLGRLGYRLRFDLTDLGQSIMVDAAGVAAEIGTAEETAEADTVLRLSSSDLARLMAGRLSPMLAFSTGRLRVEGSKGVALKLASLLDED